MKIPIFASMNSVTSTTRRRLISAWISTVISLSLVLLLVGAGVLLLVNTKAVSDYFKENMQISILMKDSVEETEAAAYEKEIASVPGVRATRLVTREEGMEEMAELLGRDFLEVFSQAPVPVSIDVNLKAKYVERDSIQVLVGKFSQSPLVEEVAYQTPLVDALNKNLGKISLFMSVLLLLLLFISVVLIANTVRLEIFSRRFSIYTMQLVGATKSFIRAPFVGRSSLQGLFSALIAIIYLVLGLFFVKGEFAQLFSVFSLDSLLVAMAVMVVSGVGICAIATAVMVNRMVGSSRDLIYAY